MTSFRLLIVPSPNLVAIQHHGLSNSKGKTEMDHHSEEDHWTYPVEPYNGGSSNVAAGIVIMNSQKITTNAIM